VDLFIKFQFSSKHLFMVLRLIILLTTFSFHWTTAQEVLSTVVTIESAGWILKGDLIVPEGKKPRAVMLMLNQAAGNRQAYTSLSTQLAENNISSLLLDLRGHGESVNKGAFEPGKIQRDPIIWDAEQDITAAMTFVRQHWGDEMPVGIIGSSYSGEESVEAARNGSIADFYIFLSPGSLSDVSMSFIDDLGKRWLLVSGKEDIYLKNIVNQVMMNSKNAEIHLLPGGIHGTDLFDAHKSLVPVLAAWIHTVIR
jgi:hypothetical protein